jgi:DNA polymerase-4
VSVGVSWNKIFAKLGSDYKKPDVTTVFSRDNWKEKIWSLPVENLLYVGPATKVKLNDRGIYTIGELANTDRRYLRSYLGVHGETIWIYANGHDTSPVARCDAFSDLYVDDSKSIGNSRTCPRNLLTVEDVKIVFFMLSESVAARLREGGFEAGVVEIYVRDSELFSFTRQRKIERPTCLATELVDEAMSIFNRNYSWNKPLRSIGIRGTDLVPRRGCVQLSFMVDELQREKNEIIEDTIDRIRARYGYFSLQRALMLKDKRLSGVDAKSEHTIHPLYYS